MVTEAIDLTGYDDWQLELLDKLRIKMLRFAGPASMFFALPMTQEEIPSELHGYLDSLAAEVLPYFCNEASPTNSLPGPFYHLKPVLHHNTFSEIKKLQLEADAQRAATQESNDLKAMSTKPIFISHASKDEAIVDHFVDSFLCLGLEVTHKDIFCSTLEGMKIITGDEWRHSILDALKGCKVVFALISPNYLASEMCLVELGAAWALPDITVLPVIIPPLEPGKSTVLLNPNQSMRIDHAGNLDQLRVDACKALNIEENVHVGRWNKKKDQFLTRVKELLELSGKKVDGAPAAAKEGETHKIPTGIERKGTFVKGLHQSTLLNFPRPGSPSTTELVWANLKLICPTGISVRFNEEQDRIQFMLIFKNGLIEMPIVKEIPVWVQPEKYKQDKSFVQIGQFAFEAGRAEQIVLAFRTKFEERNWIKLLVIQYHPPAMIDGWKRAENWEVINKLEGYAPAEIVDGKFIFFAQGEAEMERKFLWNGDKFVNAL